jgi:hypothetical protein
MSLCNEMNQSYNGPPQIHSWHSFQRYLSPGVKAEGENALGHCPQVSCCLPAAFLVQGPHILMSPRGHDTVVFLEFLFHHPAFFCSAGLTLTKHRTPTSLFAHCFPKLPSLNSVEYYLAQWTSVPELFALSCQYLDWDVSQLVTCWFCQAQLHTWPMVNALNASPVLFLVNYFY